MVTAPRTTFRYFRKEFRALAAIGVASLFSAQFQAAALVLLVPLAKAIADGHHTYKASLGPLKAAAEKLGKVDFTNLWAGQAVRMGKEMPAAELTRALAGSALARFAQMAG